MRLLNKDIKGHKYYSTSCTYGFIYTYEKLKLDKNGNRRYEVRITALHTCITNVFTCQSYDIEKCIKFFIDNNYDKLASWYKK